MELLKTFIKFVSFHVRFFVALNFCLLVLLMIFNIVELNASKSNRETSRLEYEDLQRSFGSYNFIMQPIITNFNASRVSFYSLQFDNSVAPHTLANVIINTVNTIALENNNLKTQTLTNLPVGVYSDILSDILDNKIVVRNVSDLSSAGLREMFIARGTTVAVWVPTYDATGAIIGMLAGEWNNKNSIPVDGEFDKLIKMMKFIASGCSRILVATGR